MYDDLKAFEALLESEFKNFMSDFRRSTNYVGIDDIDNDVAMSIYDEAAHRLIRVLYCSPPFPFNVGPTRPKTD